MSSASQTEDHRIELEGVTQRFHSRDAGGFMTAVDDVSFGLSSADAKVVSLVGQSGSGKSTIARMILRLQKPTSGMISYDGEDVYRLSGVAYNRFRRQVQPVFQDPYAIFNPVYQVDRVLWKAARKFSVARSRAAAASMIEESLEAVRLDPRAVLGRYPHQLSGGQRQRIMLARVHLLRPAFIIADEPVSMLDAQVRKSFLDILLSFQTEYRMTTLFITHDLSTVSYLGGDMMVITNGTIVERGPVSTVMDDPAHPYTKLLLESVPRPDPDQRWTDRISVDERGDRVLAVDQN